MKKITEKLNDKNMMKKLFYLFLIIQPILDLITSIMVRYIEIPITIGMLFRGLFILLSIIYLIFISKSRYRKKSLIYLFVLFVFCIIYLVTKQGMMQLGFLKIEFIYLFKYLYFPIATISLINMVDEFKIEREKVYKILILNVTIYALLIIVPEFTNTAFSSYLDSNKGSVGWFFAANEIGAIMVALFSFLYYLIYKNDKILKILLIFIIIITAMTILGTKTSFIGMLITEIILTLYFLFNVKKDRGRSLKISLIIVVLSFVLIPNIPAVSNLKTAISTSNNEVEVIPEEDDKETEEVVKKYYSKNTTMQRVVKIAFSGRDKFFITTLDIYKKAPLDDKIFGMGFVNREEIDNKRIEKLIEIDPLDIFFHYGIVGFIIIFMPLVAIMLKILKLFIKNRKELTFFNVTEFYVIGIITLVSMIAGHIYGAPSVSIYIALCLALLVNNNSKTKEKTTLK